MIFFLDENIPKKFISLLEGKGHEYIDIRGTDKEGMSDSDLIKMAKYRKAVLVTTDKDFFSHTPSLK